MPQRNPSVFMWAEACEMLDRAERLQRQFFRPGEQAQRGPNWEPPVDISETDGEIGIIVALPGVEPRHIDVVLDGDTLIVTGTRPLPAFSESFVIHRLEIPHGRFERRIRLQSGQLTLIRRELSNGCLSLLFTKQP